MDKNTLIGFLLIGVVLFAFSWFNRPTLSSWRRNVVTKIQSRRLSMPSNWNCRNKRTKSALVEDSLENVPDSVRAQRLQQSFGVFGEAMVGTEDYTTLQNDLVELRISNKGGRIVTHA